MRLTNTFTRRSSLILFDSLLQSIDKKPDEGVFIRGLFLEGARWNPSKQSLDESEPKKLFSEMPVIHLLPVQHRAETTSGVYRCPVYKVLSRRGARLYDVGREHSQCEGMRWCTPALDAVGWWQHRAHLAE